MSSLMRATRVTAIAVALAFVMLSTPLLQLGGNDVSVSPVNNVAAANGSRVFNVGVVDYVGDMATLNPFGYTMASEYETIWPCYSTMLTYDVNDNIIGDLASSYSCAPDGVTWTFNLANNAYFVDPSITGPDATNAQIIAANKIPSHLVTYKDVAWTFWELNNDTANHLSSYFNDGTNGIIKSITRGTSDFQVIVKTTRPYAPFLGALTIIPIVPAYIWSGVANKVNFANDPPVGSGPFFYGMSGLPTTVGILKRNPMWFQEENKGWQLHIDTLQYKNEMSTSTAWTELTMSNPLIDVFMGVAPGQYVANLVNTTTPHVKGFAQSTGFVYEYQLNQLTNALRKELGLHGSNNQLLLDPTVKLALAMSVNKPQFINDVLMGLGTVGDSPVPDVNRWHYTYPNPLTFDPAGARTLLNNAGWQYDASGNLNLAATPLYKKGTTNDTVYHPLSFRLLSLIPEQEWDTGSLLLQSWAAQAGIQYTRELVSVNQANSAWYQGDYDAWLWDWYFTPTSDPSTDILSVHTTSAIGSWSGSFYSDPFYDDLYNRSLQATDESARRQITDEMQAWLYEDHAAQYIAYRKELYAVNTVHWDEASYGDWVAHYTLMPDQGLPWLYMQLSPVDNLAPAVTVSPTFEGDKGVPISFFGSATDSSPLQYQWYWCDGNAPTGWMSSASTTHPFANDGIYTVYFAARENTAAGTDQFVSWKAATVRVEDPGNAAPVFDAVPITISPPSSSTLPDTGTVVTFTAHVTDSDPLYITWNFGDTYTATGNGVTHQYKNTGSYTVTVSVTDNHVGRQDRPVVATMGVAVKPNHAPTIDVHSLYSVPQKNQAYTFYVTGADQDVADHMKYTWIWGDKSTSVSATNYTSHTYKFNKVYVLNVYIDDQTGLAGHNVSDRGTVIVGGAVNNNPVVDSYSATPTSVWTNQQVSFSARVHDADVQELVVTFTFGDGQTYSQTISPPDANPMWVNTTHSYDAPGSMTTSVSVTDYLGTGTIAPIVVTVTYNEPPYVPDLTDISATIGQRLDFFVDAFDIDSETLTIQWVFGDGSPAVVGNPVNYTYTTAGSYGYSVSVSDGDGNMVIKSAVADITDQMNFDLVLVAGWNLVSLPMGTAYKASTLGLASGGQVVKFDPATQTYKTYVVGMPLNDFIIEPSNGYWVYASGPQTLSLTGTIQLDAQTRAVTVPAGGGWVLLGMCSMKATWHASDLATMYSGGSITQVVKWNPATLSYTTYVVGMPLNNFLLTPGAGYWVFVSASGTLSYTP